MPLKHRSDIWRTVTFMSAFALMAAVFVADILPNFPAAVSILYLAVITLGTWGRGKQAIIAWAAICGALALVAFLIVHGEAIDLSSALRLSFALVAIVITSALLISRLDLQHMRAAIQASERNMLNFTNSVPQILWRGYADGTCDYINERLEEATGMVFEPGKREQEWFTVVHPADREPYLQTMMQAFQEEKEFRIGFRMRSSDGTYRRAIVIGRPAPDPNDPSKIAYYGGVSDVHAEMEAQDEIRRLADTLEQRVEERTRELTRSEHRFRSLFYDMNIAFAETDTSAAKAMLEVLKDSGVDEFRAFAVKNPEWLAACSAGIRLVNVNDAVAQMLGYASSAELLPLPRSEFLEDADQALMLQLEAIFEGRRRSTGTGTFLRKDGTRILVAFQVNYPSDWTYGLVTYIDITEQQRAHDLVLAASEELARANRVATMGALSTSLAHELNQPITALSIDTQTCMRFLEHDPPEIAQGIKAVERLSRNINRVNGIMRRTREQLVKGRRTAEPVDIPELAREIQILLQRDLSSRGALLNVRCDPEVRSVIADRVELQQVLVNLVINAADAMTEVVDRDRLITIAVTQMTQEYVEVSVSDNGPGIPETDLSRIFQPFFTTKPEGMGMGLQICRSIIEAFGGTMSVRNGEKGGAVFGFSLPSLEDDDTTLDVGTATAV